MMKVAIVVANTRWMGGTPFMEPFIAIPILAAELSKNGIEYEIIDCNGFDFSEEQCIEYIHKSTAGMVLISALSLEYYQVFHKVAELAKKASESIITVMGGVYPTTCPEHVMEDDNIDYVMLGHAEERLGKFIKAITEHSDLTDIAGIAFREKHSDKGNEVILNPVTSYIGDLKKMAAPDYSKIDLTPYIEYGSRYSGKKRKEVSIFTTYGCPYNCVFCAVRVIKGRKIAYREVDDVIEEIRYLKDTYNIDSIRIYDENMLVDLDRARLIFERIIDERFDLSIYIPNVAARLLNKEIIKLMAEAGCVSIGISIESGCDRVLHQIIRKPLKKEIVPDVIEMLKNRGIFVSANIVIGFPGETWNEIRESISFGEKCNPDYLALYIATPYPGTDLYQLAQDNGYLQKDFDFFNEDGFSAIHSIGYITTDEFNPVELEILRAYEWDRINFSTEEKRKRFCETRGITDEELTSWRKKSRESIGKGRVSI